MPVSGFLSSFADKAQTAINASPLAAFNPKSNPDGTHGYKYTLDSIHNQLRAFSQQYSSASPIQKIVTAEKGVALDFDSLSHNSKYQSKVLYIWGQSEPDDLKDVTDRLAYLNFVEGSLADSLAQRLYAARAPLKALRDAENALAPRRASRVNLQSLIAKLEHERGSERKLAELRDLLRKAELEDEDDEKEIEIIKRKAIRESEAAKWEAIREYGERLSLVAQAATPVIEVLPAIPPSSKNPYTGTQTTAAARASLQRALDNYKTGLVNLQFHHASDLSRSDTRSFGESHANELSHINVHQSTIPPQAGPSIPSKGNPYPIDPPNLDQNPGSLLATSLPPATEPDPSQPSVTVPSVIPIVAETKGAYPTPTVGVDTGSLGRHESAAGEKERLAKEEKERAQAAEQSTFKKEDEELPPYQDIA
ncbi:hypothetical protein AX15_004836 [Amanita polypyramis BW_CC]|nr:hypothetical protein AX15_004836 [Amanita polypyramis BW_CC]